MKRKISSIFSIRRASRKNHKDYGDRKFSASENEGFSCSGIARARSGWKITLGTGEAQCSFIFPLIVGVHNLEECRMRCCTLGPFSAGSMTSGLKAGLEK